MADAPKESSEIFLGISLISYIKDGTMCGEKPVWVLVFSVPRYGGVVMRSNRVMPRHKNLNIVTDLAK
jgi:hypothetical protein